MPLRIGALWLVAILAAEGFCFTTTIEDNEGKKFRVQCNVKGQPQPHFSFKHSETVELELPAGKGQLFNSNDDDMFMEKVVVPEKGAFNSNDQLKNNKSDTETITQRNEEELRATDPYWQNAISRLRTRSRHRPAQVGFRHALFTKKFQKAVKIGKDVDTEDDDDDDDEIDDENGCTERTTPFCSSISESTCPEITVRPCTKATDICHFHTVRSECIKKEDICHKAEITCHKNEGTKSPILWIPIVMWTGQNERMIWLPVMGGPVLSEPPDIPQQTCKKMIKCGEKISQVSLNGPSMYPELIPNKFRKGEMLMAQQPLPMWQQNPYWQGSPWQRGPLQGPYSWPPAQGGWNNQPNQPNPPSWYENPNYRARYHDIRRRPLKGVPPWVRDYQMEWSSPIPPRMDDFMVGNEIRQPFQQKEVKPEVPFKNYNLDSDYDKNPISTACMKPELENEDMSLLKAKFRKVKKLQQNNLQKRRGFGGKFLTRNVEPTNYLPLRNAKKKELNKEDQKIELGNSNNSSEVNYFNADPETKPMIETKEKDNDLMMYNPANMNQQPSLMVTSNNETNQQEYTSQNTTGFSKVMMGNQDKHADGFNLINQDQGKDKIAPPIFPDANKFTEDSINKKKPNRMNTYNDDEAQIPENYPGKFMREPPRIKQPDKVWWEGPVGEDTKFDKTKYKSFNHPMMGMYPKPPFQETHIVQDDSRSESESKISNEEAPVFPLQFNNDASVQWKDMQVIDRTNDLQEDFSKKRPEFPYEQTEISSADESNYENNWPVQPAHYSYWNPSAWEEVTESSGSSWSGTDVSDNTTQSTIEETSQIEKVRYNINPGMILGPPPYVGNLPLLNYENVAPESLFKSSDSKPAKVLTSQKAASKIPGTTTTAQEEGRVSQVTTKDDTDEMYYEKNYLPGQHNEKVVSTILKSQRDETKTAADDIIKTPWNKKDKDRFDLFSPDLRSSNLVTIPPIPTDNATSKQISLKDKMEVGLYDNRPAVRKWMKPIESKNMLAANKQQWLSNKFIDHGGDRCEGKSQEARKAAFQKPASLHECQDMLGMGFDSTTEPLAAENSTQFSNKKSRGKKRLANISKFLDPEKEDEQEFSDFETRYGQMLNNLGISENEMVHPLEQFP